MLWFAIVPLLIASVVGYQCYKHVLNMAFEQEQARVRAQQFEGGSGSAVQASASASTPTFMAYNATQLPSAEASLVSPGTTANYEMATAVVTSKSVWRQSSPTPLPSPIASHRITFYLTAKRAADTFLSKYLWKRWIESEKHVREDITDMA